MFLKRNLNQDRRRRNRQLLNTSVRVFTENGSIEALGINISDVGMSLFTIANLHVDTRIQVEVCMPERAELMRTSGIVRYRALYLYGVEFLPGSDQQSENWTEAQMTGSN
jgi:hypothetical protein